MTIAQPLVSVVLPCLNEEEALPFVIRKIQSTFVLNAIDGEIVVCDNNSTDRSAEIARSLGVRVAFESRRGYGSAYLTGFENARGRYLVMGDADDSYDFSMIPQFLRRLQDGYQFVTGSRYLEGGSGKIPLLHRIVGNPALTILLNQLFNCQYTDVYCGFRAFPKDVYQRILPVTLGMEFNLELAINAGLAGLSIAEIPIKLGPRKGRSKLQTFSDGWRSLRMMLLYCPNKVFILPGLLLSSLGLTVQIAGAIESSFANGTSIWFFLGLAGAVSSILGFKIISLGLHAKTYSWSRRFDSVNPLLANFYRRFTLERGILLGLFECALGVSTLAWRLWNWISSGIQMPTQAGLIPLGITLLVIGVETCFASLFISAMSMERRDVPPMPSLSSPNHAITGDLS